MYDNKRTAIQALEQMRGDDLARAQSAFRGYTQKQMQEQHGQSGRTRQQILDEYKAHDARVSAAIDWLNSLP